MFKILSMLIGEDVTARQMTEKRSMYVTGVLKEHPGEELNWEVDGIGCGLFFNTKLVCAMDVTVEDNGYLDVTIVIK